MFIIIVSVIVKEVLISFSLYFNLDILLKLTIFIGIISVFVEGEICLLYLIIKWLCL